MPTPLSEGHARESTLEAVYREWESQRRGKLQAARRERERIIAELEGRGPSSCDQEPKKKRDDDSVEIVTVRAQPMEGRGHSSVRGESTVRDKVSTR